MRSAQEVASERQHSDFLKAQAARAFSAMIKALAEVEASRIDPGPILHMLDQTE